MVNLNDMVLFAKVAELKGISPAARVLNIPKSRVSRRVAALEEDLGTRLLERTTRAVQLTEMGEIFFRYCERVVEESENAVESMHQIMEAPRGLLRVSVSFAVGQYLIAPHLAEFLKLYSDITVQMDLNNRRVDLITEGYDLAFRVGALDDSSLMSKKVGSAKAVLCASPDYIAEFGNPTSLEHLQDHKKIVMSNSNNVSEWLLESTAGKLEAINVEAHVGINDFTALRTLIENSAGIALIPEYVVKDAIQNSRLQRILPEWQSPQINYYMLYPSRKGLTKKASAWIDFFTEKLNTL